jgi:hypothetical protein
MDTPWRLHLTNRTIQYLDILPGEPALLAVWPRRDRVMYYDLDTGAVHGETQISIPDVTDRSSLDWQNFISGLTAPNGAAMTLIRMPNAVLRLTLDRSVRLYRDGAVDLYVQVGSDEKRLDEGGVEAFLDVDLDVSEGIISAMDERGCLHLFRRQERIGTHDLDLNVQPDLRPLVATACDGKTTFVTDRQSLLSVDLTGRVLKRIETQYVVGRMACSPCGKWLMTTDMDTGVIRIYHGATLRQTHQRFAIDLLAEARQLQLIADLPPLMVALSAMTISEAGIIAFAISGVICVTSVEQMDAIPQVGPV